MCGIAGWVDWEKNLSSKKSLLEKMASSVQHRGPDAQGIWLSPHAALVHRRLIVVDPKGGLQPMILKQGENTLVLTFNGEIYNFKELREELKEKSHIFK